MKKGFTLAEVLITLAVIGVVAALTIPVLVQKYQKKQLYSQFMKTYNTFTNAMDNAIAEYGEPTEWKWGSKHYNYETGETDVTEGDNPFKNYLLSQMKYVKLCEDASDCFADAYSYLNGDDGSTERYPDRTLRNELFEDSLNDNAAILADGSVIAVGYNTNSGYGSRTDFIFDTNGKKGPNVMGRDLFVIRYHTGNYAGHAEGIYLEEWDPNGQYGDNCNPNSNYDENGEGCASRLLQEGKMSY